MDEDTTQAAWAQLENEHRRYNEELKEMIDDLRKPLKWDNTPILSELTTSLRNYTKLGEMK